MAVTFAEATLTGASASAEGLVAWATIRDALVAHPSGAWTVVEEIIGSNIRWCVLKNSTAKSKLGRDFYVCMGYRASDGFIGFMVGEEYNPATNILSKYCPHPSGSYWSYITVDGYYGGTSSGANVSNYTLPDSTPSAQPPNPIWVLVGAATSAKYFSCIEADYAIIHHAGTSVYIGGLTDLIIPRAGATGVAATPAIGVFNIFDGGVTFGSITCHPIRSDFAPMMVLYSHVLLPIWQEQFLIWTVRNTEELMTGGIWGFADHYQGAVPKASKILGVMRAAREGGNANGRASRLGALRGEFKGMRYTTGPTALVGYDTIDIDGTRWIIHGALPSLNNSYWVLPDSSSAVRPMVAFDTGVAA